MELTDRERGLLSDAFVGAAWLDPNGEWAAFESDALERMVPVVEKILAERLKADDLEYAVRFYSSLTHKVRVMKHANVQNAKEMARELNEDPSPWARDIEVVYRPRMAHDWKPVED